MQKNTVVQDNISIHDIDTIQGALESAFSTLIPRCVMWPKLTCCSRTDVGVHGLCNAAHIDIQNNCNSIYNPELILKYVNRYFGNCNHDIRLLEVIPVKEGFHVRRCVKSKTYMYRFMKAKDVNNNKVPLIELNQTYHVRSDTFDIEKIKRATKLFLGTKDFRTFCAKSISTKPINFVRELDITVEKSYPLMPYDPLSEHFEYWNIVFSAKGFLYKQVRRIVGALIAVGTDKITEKDITVMLQVPAHGNYHHNIQLAPSHGLYLHNIEFKQEELEDYVIEYKSSEDLTVNEI